MFAVVPADAAYVVERLGRYHRTLSPGVHFLTPLLDRVAFRFSLGAKDDELTGTAITRDNIPVSVTSAVRWRIVDAERAAYATADIAEFVKALVRTAQRQWISVRSWHDARETTRELEAAVERSVTDAASGAGVEITSVSVRAIDRAP